MKTNTMKRNLYLVTCKTGSFYVLAVTPNDAKSLLEISLDKADYDFSKHREVTEIKMLAKEITEFPKGKPNFCGDHDLILIQE